MRTGIVQKMKIDRRRGVGKQPAVTPHHMIAKGGTVAALSCPRLFARGDKSILQARRAPRASLSSRAHRRMISDQLLPTLKRQLPRLEKDLREAAERDAEAKAHLTLLYEDAKKKAAHRRHLERVAG